MKTPNIHSTLDDAISKLQGGSAPETVAREFPDVAEIVVIAHQLQVLAPAPRLHLDAGRRRFLTEAAHLQAQRAVRVPLWGRMLPRSAFTLAAAVLLLLVLGSTIAIAAGAVLPNLLPLPIWLNAPTATPTQMESPTLSPTEPPATGTPSPSLAPIQVPELTDTPMQPTMFPTSKPTLHPTMQPTDHSTCCPTDHSNWQPTDHPSWHPTDHPNGEHGDGWGGQGGGGHH